MPRLFESSVEALLPNPIYLLVGLGVALVLALRAPSSPRVRVGLALACAWAYLLSTPAVSRMLIDPLEAAYPSVAAATASAGDNIIVMASGGIESHRGDVVARLDTPAWERTIAAVELWRHARGRIAFVGGPVERGVSAAGTMAALALALGVPTHLLDVDTKPSTTEDSFETVPDRIWAGPGRTWLVTSALHLPRSMMSARQAGRSPMPYPCAYVGTDSPGWQQWLPSTLAYPRNVLALHEHVGLAVYAVRRFWLTQVR